MKKELTLKTVLVLVAALVTTGLFAQTPVPGYDNGGGGDNYDNAGVTYVTVGKTVPLYADPDPYFHPTYDEVTGANLTAGFTWTWTSVDAPANFTFGSAADNYVEVTGVNAGSYTINVVEEAPFGTCNDGGTNLTINVVAQPAIAYDGALAATYEDCAGGTFPAAITAVISGGYQAYRLAWTLEIKTLNPDLTDNEFYDTDKTTVLGTAGELAEEYTQAVPQAVAASGNHVITSVAGGYTVIDASTTIYTYTLQGLNDQASRWGDFLGLAAGTGVNGATAGQFQYYDTANDVLAITVHPTPTTGPIFHIDASWAN